MDADWEAQFPARAALQGEEEMSYDPQCYNLAAVFLSDENYATEKHRERLAKVIQDAIESELEDMSEESKREGQFGVGA